MSADFRQQQELEEFEQYIAEQVKWFDEQLKDFERIFGSKNGQDSKSILQGTERVCTSTQDEHKPPF